MVERGLTHSPLAFPECALTDHEPTSEKESDALDGLALYVVLPVLAEDVLRVFGISHRVDAAPVNDSFEDSTKCPDLFPEPGQGAFTGRERLLGPVRNPLALAGHL